MRRFSQRSHVVTLSEINVTPLIDLAFVLLIIFVITTPLLEQGLPLDLPKGGSADAKLERENIRTVEIPKNGACLYSGKEMSFAEVLTRLAADVAANPGIVVDIRADQMTPFDYVFQVTDLCAQAGVQVSFRSVPPTP